jgi:hypothetical protein
MATTNETTVTRTEIRRYVAEAFDNGPATREELIASARSADAPDTIVSTLERLNRRNYSELRNLWPELHDIPVTRE